MTESPEIDVTKVAFPSDGLTIKAIRERWPEAIDKREDNPYEHGGPRLLASPVDERLFEMLVRERDLAKATFDSQLGRPVNIDYADNDIKLLANDLGELYVEFGIAAGAHHAEQLVRGIESQVLAQARQFLPPRP